MQSWVPQGTGAEAEGLSAYLTTLARHSSVARTSNAKSAVFAPTLVSCGRLAFMADAGRRALRSRSVNVFPLGRWRALRRRSRWRRVPMAVDILVEARSTAEEDNLQSICGPTDLDVFQVGTPRKRPT